MENERRDDWKQKKKSEKERNIVIQDSNQSRIELIQSWHADDYGDKHQISQFSVWIQLVWF